jgi:hypothetical protein
MNPNDTRSKYRIERIKELLKAGPLDQWQIRDKVVMSSRHVRDYILYMVDAKLIHVIDWRRYVDAGPPIPVVRMGPGVNVPKPEPTPMKDKKKRQRAKLKKDPEAYEKFRKKENARRRQQPKPDDLLGWVFKPKGESNGNE